MNEEKRWVNMIKKNENEILSLNYRDFASLKVTKKTDKLNVICYELVVEIFAITEQSLDIYNLGDVEEILTKIKRSIEKLYSQICCEASDLNCTVCQGRRCQFKNN